MPLFPCSNCGVHTNKTCSRCTVTHYCSVACQKACYRQHKSVCFPPGSVCTRCGQTLIVDGAAPSGTVSSSKPCCVPHPPQCNELKRSLMRMEYGGSEELYECSACNQGYMKVGDCLADTETDWTYVPSHSRYCYKAPHHTIHPIPLDDLRRASRSHVTLKAGEKIQDQIDALDPEHIAWLRICSAYPGGTISRKFRPVLNLALPHLKELALMSVAFTRIVLTPETAPQLTSLTLRKLYGDCRDTVITCPNLTDIRLELCGSQNDYDSRWMHDMVCSANGLVNFRADDLLVDHITLVNVNVKTIALNVSKLKTITIWAPRLERLDMKGCSALETLVLLDEPPLESMPMMDVQEELSPATTIQVDTTNSTLSSEFKNVLLTHPRVSWEGGNDADES